MTKPAVFIARRVFGDIVDRLRAHFDVRTHEGEAPLSQPELIAALQGCDGVFITGSEKIDAVLLAACPQAAFTQFHRVIKRELGLGDHEMVVCGMALGHADPAAVANRLTTARASVDEFARFHA